MNNVIDLNAYRAEQQTQEIATAYYDAATLMFDMYLHYFVYPLVAAVMSANSKRIVKVSHY